MQNGNQHDNAVLIVIFNNRNKCFQFSFLHNTIGQRILNLFKAEKFQKSQHKLEKQDDVDTSGKVRRNPMTDLFSGT